MERLGDARRWERIETDSGVGRPRHRPARSARTSSALSVHPVRPRARRRAVAQRTDVRIAPTGARGPVRNRIPGSIERRQALLLDGIRMSIEMAQIGYRRVQSTARRRQAVERVGGIARRVGTCGHAEPTTGADQSHDLRAGRVHQTGDGDREFNVDVTNWGT